MSNLNRAITGVAGEFQPLRRCCDRLIPKWLIGRGIRVSMPLMTPSSPLITTVPFMSVISIGGRRLGPDTPRIVGVANGNGSGG